MYSYNIAIMQNCQVSALLYLLHLSRDDFPDILEEVFSGVADDHNGIYMLILSCFSYRSHIKKKDTSFEGASSNP